MIDPIKILQRAWQILWSYRTLWLFGLILALAVGGSTSNGGNNNSAQWRQENGNYQPPSVQGDPIKSWEDFTQEVQKLFREGIPQADITGPALTAFIWTVVVFILVMFLIGILISIAYYVSVTSVIRMVNEYENNGTKLTFREGWRIGWSRAAWRVFLINLIVNLPGILLLLALLIAGVIIFLTVVGGNMTFTGVTVVIMIALLILIIFVVIILSILLSLLRPFFWRIAVLEDAGVRESLRRGIAMVREHWKSAGLMWLVMIGLGFAWMIASVILFFITLPILFLTAALAVVVVAIPGLLLVGLFSLFLSGPLPWIAAGLFMLPLFFLIAFSPWLVLGSWQQVYTSTVWTLTYREIKALPAALIPQTDLEPVGD